MSREATAAAVTQLEASTKKLFFLFELENSGSTLRYSSLNFDLSWNSQTWLGDGTLIKVGDITENLRGEAEAVSVELAAEPGSIISFALSNLRQYKPAKIYLGFFDASYNVIADPIVIFSGVFDSAQIQDTVDISVLKINLSSKLATLQRAPGLRYNDATQQQMFPGDLAFEYLPQFEEGFQIYWGKPRKLKRRDKRRRNRP